MTESWTELRGGLSDYSVSGSQIAADITLTGTEYLNSRPPTPVIPPALALDTATGSLTIGTSYYFTYAWYDPRGPGTGAETPFYTPAPHVTIVTGSQTVDLLIPSPPAPDLHCRIYAATGAITTVGAGNAFLQNTVVMQTGKPKQTTISTFTGAGITGVSDNTFPDEGNTGFIRPAGKEFNKFSSGAYGWTLEGNGRIRFLGPTINDQFWFYDEFIFDSIANATWANTNSGTAAGYNIGGNSTHPGLLRIATGTTTTGRSDIYPNGIAPSLAAGAARIRFSASWGLNQIPDNTDRWRFFLGLSSTRVAATLPKVDINTVGFEFSTNGSSAPALRLTVTADAPAITVTSTAVDALGNALVPADGDIYFTEFEIDSDGSTIDWWVNGVKQTQLTGRTMTSSMMPVAGVIKAAGTTAVNLQIDNIAIYGDFVS